MTWRASCRPPSFPRTAIQQQVATTGPYDAYLPEPEDLNRLEALLSEMLMKTQSEVDRLSPRPKEACHG
jgi:hypothetical protein